MRQVRADRLAMGLIVALAPAVATSQPPPGSGPLAAYYAVLGQYRSGETSRAVATALTWDARRVGRDVREFARQRQQALPPSGGSLDPEGDRLTRTAVALHTEAYLRAAEAQPPAPAQDHLEHARTLLTLLAHPDHEPFVRLWYLTVAVSHQAELRLSTAQTLLEEGLGRFPDDEHLLVAAGSVHETLASPRAGHTRRPLAAPADPPGSAVAAHLRIAEDFHRRALEHNPAASEARLRLARVLLERGAPDEALRELGDLGAAGGPGFIRYTAQLLSGRAHERAGRLEEAAASYRTAASVCPRCQVPVIALSAVLARAGEREASAAAMAEMLGTSGYRIASSDPWHFYDFGQRWRLGEILVAFRQEAQR